MPEAQAQTRAEGLAVLPRPRPYSTEAHCHLRRQCRGAVSITRTVSSHSMQRTISECAQALVDELGRRARSVQSTASCDVAGSASAASRAIPPLSVIYALLVTGKQKEARARNIPWDGVVCCCIDDIVWHPRWSEALWLARTNTGDERIKLSAATHPVCIPYAKRLHIAYRVRRSKGTATRLAYK